MSEENKTVELKDNELKKVSGGGNTLRVDPNQTYCSNAGPYYPVDATKPQTCGNCYYERLKEK